MLSCLWLELLQDLNLIRMAIRFESMYVAWGLWSYSYVLNSKECSHSDRWWLRNQLFVVKIDYFDCLSPNLRKLDPMRWILIVSTHSKRIFQVRYSDPMDRYSAESLSFHSYIHAQSPHMFYIFCELQLVLFVCMLLWPFPTLCPIKLKCYSLSISGAHYNSGDRMGQGRLVISTASADGMIITIIIIIIC